MNDFFSFLFKNISFAIPCLILALVTKELKFFHFIYFMIPPILISLNFNKIYVRILYAICFIEAQLMSLYIVYNFFYFIIIENKYLKYDHFPILFNIDHTHIFLSILLISMYNLIMDYSININSIYNKQNL